MVNRDRLSSTGALTAHKLVLSCFLVGMAQWVNAVEWHSFSVGEFSFEATIEGVEMPGHFEEFVVDFDHDPIQPDESRLRVTIDLRSADMGDPELNTTLFDPAWFDVQQFAEAQYESTSLTVASPDQYVAHGTLELKGTSKSVVVPFTWTAQDDKATMQGRFKIQRTDFDVGSGEWASGDSVGIDVNVSFTIELKRAE